MLTLARTATGSCAPHSARTFSLACNSQPTVNAGFGRMDQICCQPAAFCSASVQDLNDEIGIQRQCTCAILLFIEISLVFIPQLDFLKPINFSILIKALGAVQVGPRGLEDAIIKVHDPGGRG